MYPFTLKHQSAFTLLEITMVVTIIGIMAMFALPRYLTLLEKFRAKEGEHLLLTLLAAQKRYSIDNAGSYTGALINLDVDIRDPENFAMPTVAANPLARIDRVGNLYTLSINASGTISCSSGSGICVQIGY